MKVYGVAVIKPHNYAHWRAFDEAEQSFRVCLKELDAFGIAEYNDTTLNSIVFGSHTAPTAIEPNDILFNTEVPGSPWFTKEYIEALKTHEVWDYSAQNICALYEQYGVEAKHCPIGYHECLEKIDQHTEKDIDVLFYGSMTERRKPIWEKVLATGLNCRHLFGIYGSVRDAYIARSKCVLDMAAYENSPRNDFRLSYLWANRVRVINEKDVADFSTGKASLFYWGDCPYHEFKTQLQIDAIRKLIQ